ENVGKARVPIINYTGGTEISGGILGCFPSMPIKPCSFAAPIPGMAADVFDERGRRVRGQVGELVGTAPWPGMTQGCWKAQARKPERVLFARDLPRTRSATIMRRVIRATYLGKEAGDLSSLENPAAVKAITDAV